MKTLRKYVGVQTTPSTHSTPGSVAGGPRVTRSQEKPQHYIVVSNCVYCNTGHLEMFLTNLQKVHSGLPLKCDHGHVVFDIVLETNTQTGVNPIRMRLAGGLDTFIPGVPTSRGEQKHQKWSKSSAI